MRVPDYILLRNFSLVLQKCVHLELRKDSGLKWEQPRFKLFDTFANPYDHIFLKITEVSQQQSRVAEKEHK